MKREYCLLPRPSTVGRGRIEEDAILVSLRNDVFCEIIPLGYRRLLHLSRTCVCSRW